MRGTVRKRGKTWGWQFRVRTRTISKSGYATRKAAALDLHEALARLGRGDKRVLVKASTMTLAEYLPGWLAGRHELKASTLSGYRTAIGHIVRDLGPVRLADVDAPLLVGFFERLRREGGRPTKAARVRAAAYGTAPVGSALGTRSVKGVHVVLSMALADAVETGLMPTNPCQQIPKRSRPTHRARLIEGKVWEPDEATTFLAATRADRWHALWALGLDSGARRGELLGLRWRDLDLDGRVVTFARNRVLVDGTVVETTPKSHRPRKVDIGDHTAAALHRWARRQMAETGRSEFVFTDETGEPVRPDRVTRLFRRACRTAGVRYMTVHGLRHTNATLSLRAGVPLHVVSRRLGHANTMVTANLYAHVLGDQGTDAAAALGAVLYGGA